MRKTKIVCTLGPASADEKVMEAMLRAGMNVARFNFSHGTHESHREMMQRFRAVRDRLGVAAAVMLDTKGPEIRLKDMAGGEAMLTDGAEFTLTARDVQGDAAQVSITYAELPREVKAGDRILIDDGRVSLRVQETTDTDIRCLVEHGGRIATHKGVNVPGVHLNMPYLSEADKSDLIFGIENDVDYVAASFARSARGISKFRPEEPIVGATPDEKTFQQLSLSWGVYPVRSLRQNSTEELCRHVVDCARNADVIDEGDLVVITAGEPQDVSKGTTLLRVQNA